jgi:hypothetical protein
MTKKIATEETADRWKPVDASLLTYGKLTTMARASIGRYSAECVRVRRGRSITRGGCGQGEKTASIRVLGLRNRRMLPQSSANREGEEATESCVRAHTILCLAAACDLRRQQRRSELQNEKSRLSAHSVDAAQYDRWNFIEKGSLCPFVLGSLRLSSLSPHLYNVNHLRVDTIFDTSLKPHRKIHQPLSFDEYNTRLC